MSQLSVRHFFEFHGCGGSNRTNDLKVMSLASYHCSTPRYNLVPMSGVEPPTAGV